MNSYSRPNSKPQTPQYPTYQRKDNGGGAPGPKYTIPCPPPRKK